MNPVDVRIEAYLDRLVRPLERTLEPEGIEEVRLGALFHLEALVERERERGRSQDESVRTALEEYGSPEKAGAAMLDEWCRGRDAMTFARLGPAAFWWSFGFFGLAYAVALLALEAFTLWPGLSIADGHGVGIAVMAVASALAGAATGRRVPTGNLAALLFALTPLIPYSLLVLFVARPALDPGPLAAMLIVCAGVGGLSLSLTAWLCRHGRPPVSPRFFHEQSV